MSHRKLAALFSLVLLLAVLPTCEPSGSRTSRSATRSQSAQTPEQELAGRDGRAAADFRTVLNSLSTKYRETSAEISNMTIRAQQMLREAGNDATLFSIMQGIDAATRQNAGRQRYSEHVAAYLALRNERGQTHDVAVSNLRELLRTLATTERRSCQTRTFFAANGVVDMSAAQPRHSGQDTAGLASGFFAAETRSGWTACYVGGKES